MSGQLEVRQPGIGSTVQDRGRPGHRHHGLPLSGWLDAPLARAANALLGNDLNAAVLELRGVGTALLAAAIDLADRWLQLRRLELQVYADNAAGIALYTRQGFVEEGRHRDYAFRDGSFVDALSMARIRG